MFDFTAEEGETPGTGFIIQAKIVKRAAHKFKENTRELVDTKRLSVADKTLKPHLLKS